MIHRVTLSNGTELVLEEEDNALSVAVGVSGLFEPEWYLARITADGILVLTNSGDGVEMVADGLRREQLPQKKTTKGKKDKR